MSSLVAFNFQNWIEENRTLLKPPVGNKVVFRDSTLMVMAVGGPNARTDFHVNQTDEFFYQLEGDIFLRVVIDGQIEEVHLQAGDVFMLPAGTPHSPQRGEASVGLVVEHTRTPGTVDRLQWYCAACTGLLYEESFFLSDVETAFGPVFDRYFGSEHELCKACGHQNGRVWNPPGADGAGGPS